MMGCFAVACILNVYKMNVIQPYETEIFSIPSSIPFPFQHFHHHYLPFLEWFDKKKFIECEWLFFQSATKTLLRKKQWPVTWHEIFIGFHKFATRWNFNYSTYTIGRIPLYAIKNSALQFYAKWLMHCKCKCRPYVRYFLSCEQALQSRVSLS